ncbi:MAG TPA: PilZ domain-containing protein [Gemmataceae bacterium]|nr:PilZ domain-containing protein [Gemmataceae bacterium]
MTTETAALPRDRRTNRRRPVKSGATVTARKGALGLGPNVVLAPVTLSDDGISLRVNRELTKGDELEITLIPPGRAKFIKLMGDVRWCRAGAHETYVIGVQFRRRLRYVEVGELA